MVGPEIEYAPYTCVCMCVCAKNTQYIHHYNLKLRKTIHMRCAFFFFNIVICREYGPKIQCSNYVNYIQHWPIQLWSDAETVCCMAERQKSVRSSRNIQYVLYTASQHVHYMKCISFCFSLRIVFVCYLILNWLLPFRRCLPIKVSLFGGNLSKNQFNRNVCIKYTLHTFRFLFCFSFTFLLWVHNSVTFTVYTPHVRWLYSTIYNVHE